MLIVCEHSLDSPQLHCLFLPRGLLSTPMGLDNVVIGFDMEVQTLVTYNAA